MQPNPSDFSLGASPIWIKQKPDDPEDTELHLNVGINPAISVYLFIFSLKNTVRALPTTHWSQEKRNPVSPTEQEPEATGTAATHACHNQRGTNSSKPNDGRHI